MIIHYLLLALSLQEAEIMQVDDVSNWCHPSTAVDRGEDQRAGRVGWVNTYVKDDRRRAARVYKTWFGDSSTNKKHRRLNRK